MLPVSLRADDGAFVSFVDDSPTPPHGALLCGHRNKFHRAGRPHTAKHNVYYVHCGLALTSAINIIGIMFN